MKLTSQLKQTVEDSSKMIPVEIQKIMSSTTEKFINEGLSKKAKNVGDTLPDTTLVDINNTPVDLLDLHTNEYLIVSFYRGGWCPYCNLELKALQNELASFKELGANLVAITPETPDNSLTTNEKNELSFSILSDIDNQYAKKLGLVFQLPKNLSEIYLNFNIDLEKHNGNQKNELPMPATYVINKNNKIVYAFISEDYTLRLDPKDILDTIKSI